MGTTGLMLIFDGDCAICTSMARWVERRVPDAEVVPFQRIDDLGCFGLTLHDVETAAYWVDDRGAHRGHRAVNAALRRVGGGWGVLGRVLDLPPLRPLGALAYAVVSRNRHRLPGATPACRLDDG